MFKDNPWTVENKNRVLQRALYWARDSSSLCFFLNNQMQFLLLNPESEYQLYLAPVTISLDTIRNTSTPLIKSNSVKDKSKRLRSTTHVDQTHCVFL